MKIIYVMRTTLTIQMKITCRVVHVKKEGIPTHCKWDGALAVEVDNYLVKKSNRHMFVDVKE